MTSKSFTNEPMSITEVRSLTEDSAREWTPRDVLVHLLRDIDSGKLDMDALVVLYRYTAPEGKVGNTSWMTSSPDPYTSLGIVRLNELKVTRSILGED
jgi:hypothetical protein